MKRSVEIQEMMDVMIKCILTLDDGKEELQHMGYTVWNMVEHFEWKKNTVYSCLMRGKSGTMYEEIGIRQ